MSQLFQKIAQFLANELVTKRLANSSTFINAAHKTHQHVQKTKQAAQETSKTLGGTVKDTHQNAKSFFQEVKDELLKGPTK